MIPLAERQSQFMEKLLDEDADQPDAAAHELGAGLAIYRNNYRATLMEAMLDTFKRTARWVGQDVFHQAAAHHLIVNPPTGWTLDDVGAGFDLTLAELFAQDPEVSELAWVEWSMHRAFGSASHEPLTAKKFAEATSKFGEADWGALCLEFVPGLATCVIRHDIGAIWYACDAEEISYPLYSLDEPLACHVFREGEQPTFITAQAFESSALRAMIDGANFGDVVDLLLEMQAGEAAATQAGEMLGRWLANGIVVRIKASTN